MNEKIHAVAPSQLKIQRKTVKEVYSEYCEFGLGDKAYATIKNRTACGKSKYGKRYIDDITVAEINDYLTELYYCDNRSYSYTESFLKIFYLIFGQAYSRNYLGAEQYDKLCKNTKIHMPKMKIDEETDIIIFTDEQVKLLSDYFYKVSYIKDKDSMWYQLLPFHKRGVGVYRPLNE